jgi:hypothetical protein
MQNERIYEPMVAGCSVACREGCAGLRGLCVTCVHRLTCAFARRATRPVLCCEEFEGELNERGTGIGSGHMRSDRAALANREWYPGLRSHSWN